MAIRCKRYFPYICNTEYQGYIDAFDFCNIKCNAGQIEDLLDKYEGVQPGYHMNKKHWISVYFDKDVPDKMIKDLVKQSYEIVVSSLARREREILQAM